MKLSKIINPKFQTAIKKLNAQELPLKVAFKLKGITKKVQAELDKYEEVRQRRLQELGKKDKDGKVIVDDKGDVKVSAENLKTFAKELSELASADVALQTISVNDLNEDITMSAEEMFMLDELIVE